MPDAETIASELRAAYARGWEEGRRSVWTYFAPTIDIRHQPPLPHDGPTPATVVEEQSVAEFASYKRVLAGFREENAIRVDGNRVVCDLVLIGTAADGTELRAPVRQVLTVEDGLVTASEVSLDPEVLAKLVAIVRPGGES
jgi:hypothetical protein